MVKYINIYKYGNAQCINLREITYENKTMQIYKRFMAIDVDDIIYE